MVILFFLIAFAVAGWYLWVQAKNRRSHLDELQKRGFHFDEAFALGDSDLLVDRTRGEVAFHNWSALMIQHNTFYVAPSDRRYRTIQQQHPFSDVLAVQIEKPNKRTYRAIRFEVAGEFFRRRPEYAGSYQSLLAVVPAFSLEKLLPRLQTFVESDLGKKIEFVAPFY